MAPLLDCMVSYYGLDEYGRPSPWRYFCYHVLAGPGPTPGSGIAFITTLAYAIGQEQCHRSTCDSSREVLVSRVVADLVPVFTSVKLRPIRLSRYACFQHRTL